MKKDTQDSHYFALSNLLTQTVYITAGHASSLLNMQIYIAYIIDYYICLPLCAHILYFDAAKNKTVFIDIFVCFCCQTTEWIWKSVETRPIKTT